MTFTRTSTRAICLCFLSLALGSVWSCSMLLDRDDAAAEMPVLAVAESPGTGTTGGNPSSSLVVGVDVPESESMAFRWETPTLNFDQLRIRRVTADGGCGAERIITLPEMEVRLAPTTGLAFLREDVCEVGIRRVSGPVLHLIGRNDDGRVMDISLGDGSELVMDVARWRATPRNGGVLSIRPRRLLTGLMDLVLGDEVAEGIMLSDADLVTGDVLRQNLQNAIGGYVDLNLDGVLSEDELVDAARFLRVTIRR